MNDLVRCRAWRPNLVVSHTWMWIRLINGKVVNDRTLVSTILNVVWNDAIQWLRQNIPKHQQASYCSRVSTWCMSWDKKKKPHTLQKSSKRLQSLQLFIQQLDWLIIYGFTTRSRIFHLYGDVTIAGEGLQNLGLCSMLGAFEQAGIFIVPHLLLHGTSVFPVSSEGPPHLVAFYDTQGVWRTYSYPDPHGRQLIEAWSS
jgi:hypothetical protein